MKYMPTLVVRTRHASVAVQMNGMPVGDAAPDRHLALPLSESGEYYIGMFPLADDGRRYYPVVRKLRFSDGALSSLQSEDVEAYAWPGGLFEVVFDPGVLPEPPETAFPYTVDQMQWGEGRVATLYYENGLRLAIEEGLKLQYGTVLGNMLTGKLYPLPGGLLCAVAGAPHLPGGDIPARYGQALLILDSACNELLRIRGDAVGMEGENAVRFLRLPTQLMHERREVYRLTDGAYRAEGPVTGFFTHAPRQPAGPVQVIRAFCEAVRYDLWEEAFSYLSPGLAAGLTPQTIRDCMGGFIALREPYANDDSMLGLCYAQQDGIVQVRVFTFSFENGKIDNISEE